VNVDACDEFVVRDVIDQAEQRDERQRGQEDEGQQSEEQQRLSGHGNC
jgi:hypothetical protein